MSEDSFPRKLHVVFCEKCGGLGRHFGDDGWMCSECYGYVPGPDDVEEENEK